MGRKADRTCTPPTGSWGLDVPGGRHGDSSLFLPFQDNGPDEAPSGTWISCQVHPFWFPRVKAIPTGQGLCRQEGPGVVTKDLPPPDIWAWWSQNPSSYVGLLSVQISPLTEHLVSVGSAWRRLEMGRRSQGWAPGKGHLSPPSLPEEGAFISRVLLQWANP